MSECVSVFFGGYLVQTLQKLKKITFGCMTSIMPYTVMDLNRVEINGLVHGVSGEKKEACCIGWNRRHSLEVVRSVKKGYSPCRRGAYN